jgi:hypothetical protein
MKKRISNIVVSLFLFTSMVTQAQIIPANDNILAQQYPFVRTVYNRISNAGNLDSFFKKLYQLKTTNTGVVSIVHIGDSHIQADFFSGILRDGLQDFFGNAGRGLVFPYQLAKSNAPQDISSSSSTNWQFNRLAHPEISIPYGVSGYGLITNAANANISLSLKPEAAELSSFDHLKFFLDSNTTTSWIVQADNNTDPYLLKKEQGDTSLCQQIILDEASSGFLLSSLPSGRSKEFYGVSLENSDPGIIYHTLGVNGARYDQYNIASLFWKQLPALKADLYIVSLGTNEAQAASFSETTFSKQLTIFIQK